MSALPARARIVEVGPRDGLQNEAVALDIDTRLELVRRLMDCGLRDIEAGAFVSPRRVPNMAGSGDLARRLPAPEGVHFPCLVPNDTGLDAALAAGCRDIAVFTAVSETFSQRNTACSVAESLQRLSGVARRALDAGVRVRGYLSCVATCPYEGPVAAERVADLAQRLMDMGCYEVSLGDTTGTGTPEQIRRLFDLVSRRVPTDRLAGHFHDTWGMGVANVYAALLSGVSVFDASVGGLGGCPFAPGASGNVATEDVVYMLSGAGIETGVALDELVDTACWISARLGRPPASRVARAHRGSGRIG
ncbi:hydroxymethylglutaryl-CoA lyase [Methyloversatilis thermotolerans]|uniref:hydroxymethylglutaryl-CoA lyase n=1 Tax=Methyloversatilis thermotolerans TaxID=1346290 RepID=UPI00035CD2DE|nr:hydroxymethylglutaryl-CoA lyase [Methyloversatilis thermotolerans]